MKVHIAHSAEPIVHRFVLAALCGKDVANPVFAFMWDDIAVGAPLEFNAWRVCSNCRHRAVNQKLDRYVYGIVPGEEAEDFKRETNLAEGSRP